MFVTTLFAIKTFTFILLSFGKLSKEQPGVHEQHRAAWGVPPHNKNDIIYLTFPLQNYYQILPKQKEILVV